MDENPNEEISFEDVLEVTPKQYQL